MLKMAKIFRVSLTSLLITALPAAAQQVSMGEGISHSPKKILVAFYSYSGNTKDVATEIKNQTGADLFEIETVKPYPTIYNSLTKQAKEEIQEGFKPEIKKTVQNIREYDVIFVGSPSWWSTIAPPVATFLSRHDLSGKTVIPFVTHGGTGLGRNSEDTAKLCPEAMVQKGAAFWGRNAKNSQEDISKWLKSLNL